MKHLFHSLFCILLLWATCTAQAVEPHQDWVYTARPNDTLQTIAEKYLMPDRHWDALVRYNKLDGSGRLKAGTLINIPVAWLKHYPQPATLIVTHGDVWLRRAHTTNYIPALPGSKLNIGDELKTQEGQALVKFADGSSLSVAYQSIVIFNTLTHFSDTGMVDTRFRLLKGSIETNVTPRKGPAARYEVTTPSAVAAVRGTAFRMNVTATVTVTEVTKGVVEVSNNVTSRRLTKGQGAVVSESITFGDLPLLPAPDVKAPATMSELPFQLTWAVLDGAVAYRVELFTDDPDTLPILAERIDSPNIELPRLNNGEYRLRIRGIAADDLEGVDTEVKFRVEQKAAPAKLLQPLSGAFLDIPSPTFSWKVEAPYMLSSLEISHDPQFTELYSRSPFSATDNTQSDRPLSAGKYYWRVVTLVGGDNFNYSQSRPLTIQGRLDPTEVIAVNYLEDQAKVFWKTVPDALGYHVQLAEDELFTRVIREYEIDKTYANVLLEPGKTYWIRVKGLGDDLHASEFGQAQIIKIQSR
ncbi:peptidoglycan-binding protein [Hahella sp. CCB-MM4]|uniref:FecR domain-containing protein n=1 Tax=Hahella sp. (strain CCB-MM4) TaxID=1926491 RepID=UPI000B9B35F0|nr:FecR domain-containing protein [Hahella sp. CCB-MM4]OZG72581.1 peptidoglycan-binding protein [Hahella sp. CCB-MM4]